MRDPLLVPDLRELIRAGETAALGEFLADHHPARVAEIIEDLGPDEGGAAFDLLEPRMRAEVMGYLDHEAQAERVGRMSPEQAAELLHLMSHDERADLVNRLDDDLVDAILPRLARAEREDIRRLASFEPGTAGAVMTTDYATLPPQLTVREAIDRLRHEAPDRETIYYSYVVAADRRLIGLVSLKNLILARPRARIEEILQRDLVSARVDEDQESVARKISQYDLIAIPVVDAEGRLVGIVTHDDAMDILKREQTEDMLKFGGVAADAEAGAAPYWQGTIASAVRRRIGWLLFLFFGGTITSLVLSRFNWVEDALHNPKIDLDVFIPLLIGTGGNAGSQTVGTIIRGLALGEIRRGDAPRVLAREALTGLLLGTLLGALGFLYTHYVLGHPRMFSAVVGLATVGICLWANAVGALIPLLARKVGVDPALVSAPLISTLVDATGLIIYYRIAILLLIRLAH
ncbi:MAG TPA: magnesium transporter [Isosphaeraceae bacterium]|nr:magnesium transporter [Isosphaeraceae bacterium]